MYTDKARQLLGKDVCAKGTVNFYAIGIELEPIDIEGNFSEPTLKAAAELCADILRRHNKTVDILTTHHEIVGWKDCPRLWTNNPEQFDVFKSRVQKLLEVA